MPLKPRLLIERQPRVIAPGQLYVVVLLDGVQYAIHARHVQRAMLAADATGSMPVIDLRVVFGLPRRAAGPSAAVIAETPRGVASILVDAVVTLARIEDRAFVALPEIFDGGERQRFEGLARHDGRIIPVLKTDGLISAGAAA
jgi:hypothetical protein